MRHVHLIQKSLLIMVSLCLTTHCRISVLPTALPSVGGCPSHSLAFVSSRGGSWDDSPAPLVACPSWVFDLSVLVVYRLNLHVTERLLSALCAVSRQQSNFWMLPSKCKGFILQARAFLMFLLCHYSTAVVNVTGLAKHTKCTLVGILIHCSSGVWKFWRTLLNLKWETLPVAAYSSV